MKQFLMLIVLVGAAHGMVCPENICDSIRCQGIKAEECKGRVDSNGGFCGCCPSCVLQANEGETCLSALLLMGVPRNVECAENLYCDTTSGKCQKKTCAMNLKALQSSTSKPLLGQPIPRCEKDGTYSPVQCIGSVCFCVNKQGEKLLSDPMNRVAYQGDIADLKKMNCRCAVEQHEYMKTGLIGKMFSCTANGNYDRVGCTGSVCFCTDEEGNKLGDASVHITQKNSLNC